LIICANQLELIQRHEKEIAKSGNNQKNAESKDTSKENSVSNQSVEEGLIQMKDDGFEQFSVHKEEYVETLLGIIDQIFYKHADVNV
jgi:hypothetical protein